MTVNPMAGKDKTTELSPFRFNSWDKDHSPAALEALFEKTTAEAQRGIDWYERKAGKMGLVARALRRTSILLAGFAALAPLTGSLLGNITPAAGSWLGWLSSIGSANLGYIALAIAGGAVTLDNFFGYSTAWMRYRLTEAGLRRQLRRFHYDWASLISAAASQDLVSAGLRESLIRLQRQYIDAHSAAIEQETRMWAEQLQVNLLGFDSSNKFQRFDQLPGAAAITIKGYDALAPDSVKLTLNDRPLAVSGSGAASASQLSPGLHVLKLSATTSDAKAVSAERTLTILSDRTETFDIEAKAA